MINKIALITGASSGIGKACAEKFAAAGANLILTARRIKKIEQLAEQLSEKFNIQVLSLRLDVQDKTAVKTTIENLPEQWRNIDILINNAGLALDSLSLQDGNIENWETMIDTNVKGLLYVTHSVLQNMVANNNGHIINIGSIAGHECYPAGNVYCASKHAVKAISKSMRMDLLDTKIRVSEIDPGVVHTEFSSVRWKDKQRADDFYRSITPLQAQDVADAIFYIASAPAHVNVAEILILPADQASSIHFNKKE